METIDELTAFLTTATVDGILGRLLYRGAAWSLMRAEGKLPPNAPPLGGQLTLISPNTALPCSEARWPCVLKLVLRS